MRLAADNLWAVIEAATAEELDWLDGYLTVPVKGAEYSEAYERGVWDGSVKLLDRKRSRIASGLLRLVAGRAKEAGFAFEVKDVRTKPFWVVDNRWEPDAIPWLRDYQREALGVVLGRGRGIVSMPTGCLSGDTEIGAYRAGRSFRIKIRDLERGQNGRGLRPWTQDIQTKVRCREEDGFIRVRSMKGVYRSGIKTTFTVETKGGKKIRATADHRFLTVSGWERLGDLSPGMHVFVEKSRGGGGKPKGKKNWYQLVAGLRAHPYVGRKGVKPGKGGWSVPKHRLVAEARLNGLSFEKFVGLVRRGRIADLKFLDPKVVSVHHRDENPRNNEGWNLDVMPKDEHHRVHGKQGGWQHVTASTFLDEIVSIERFGEEETFDIEMEADPRNFIANGIVVHNSGKTQVFSALGACVGIRWLVLVDTKDLMHQAADRFYQLTGERAGLAGDGEWEPRRYTVATLQTLHKHMGDKGRVDQLLASAQGMIADEVQVLSATEFRKVAVATVNAWWRVGFSATPFERSDEADYRAIEVLGPLIHDVMPGPLIAAGWLAEPRIWMVRHQHQKMTGSFAEVYEAGVTLCEGRNALVRRIVADRDLCPRPSMLFFSKLAHGRALDRSLNPLGVRTVFVEGASSSRARDSARHQLRVRLRDVLVTSKVFNKGIDIPEVEGGVNAAAGDSRIDALQKVGRLMRVVEGKNRVVRYFDFDDVGNRWLEQHSRHRADAFRSRGYTVHHVRPEDLGAIARAA